jgi:hypothetical protein
MRTVAAIALTRLGIRVPAKTHYHQQEAEQGVAGNVSDTDAWRHFLLHVAANLPTTTLPSDLDNNFRVAIQHCLEVPRRVREGHR